MGANEAGELAETLLALPDPPSAIFAASDLQAIGVLKAAERLGVRVPEELAVIGFDDVDLAEIVGLTTIRQPLREGGALAADLLLAAIEDGRRGAGRDLPGAVGDRAPHDVIDARAGRSGHRGQNPTAKPSIVNGLCRPSSLTPSTRLQRTSRTRSRRWRAASNAATRGLTLLGATGTGKTMTMAATIEAVQRPALIMAHNKTLAAQLCNEFRTYFPTNSVEYFVSYYDYYQPEAYVPSRDLYIEKDSAINQEIDRLRHAATASLFARRDVIIVASVSCIFGLGSPETYNENCQVIVKGHDVDRDELLRKLVSLQYNRNDTALGRGTFRVRGETLEVFPAYEETAFRVLLFGDEVERLQHFDPLTGEIIKDDLEHVAIWPATHYNVKEGTMERAVTEIGHELNERCAELEAEGKLLESHRLRQRTQYDMEMLKEVGFCSGIENYSRILDGRAPGLAPVLPARLLPQGLRLLHRRVAPDRAADRRHVRGRPLAQVDARQLRLPAAERDGQPPADVRRVALDHAADGLRLGHARPVREGALADARRADRAPDRDRGPRDRASARPRTRSTT